MPRLRNSKTGVVVNVDEAAAARLGTEWVPASKGAAPTPPPVPEVAAPKGNASREAWAAYADTVGVAYPDEAKRDEIKTLVGALAKAK